ncbi:MAG: hypothetical protein J6J27_03835 [Alphaproteobacteria bacterium]|nr:hypothetical protein [Alphaproteobacteria bacterium]
MKKVSILTLSLIMLGGIARAEDSVALQNVNSKIEAVQNTCSGIKSSLDTIFGLSVATTVSSGLGTVAAGGALAVGIAKAKTDKKQQDLIAMLDDYKINPTEEKKQEILKGFDNLKNSIDKAENEISNLEKKSKTLGNVRTGLMAGATATSAVSTGTSLGATLTATKLAEKMMQCNADLQALKLAKSELEAEGETNEKADKILSVCTGYDEANIKSLKSLATANAVVSGIGTATAGAGTITSAMANSKKVRAGDKKKEKSLNLASNILAGVTMGTSATSTTLSAVQISKAKKDSEMAEKCENILVE